jgi:hypothetical protein
MKKQIELSIEQAREWYNDPEGFKKTLIANFSKEELEKKQLPKSWEELRYVNGWYVTSASRINLFDANAIYSAKNTFATQKQAESALARAQLSQLMKVYNGDWEADWRNFEYKYIIVREYNILEIYKNKHHYNFLAFPTAELRDEFFENFEELIKTYYEL